MVFYRKYRPQTISELDLEDVREKLSALLTTQEVPHALLFSGPKGLGKTSAARILAKAINCEQKSNEPCNVCSACVSITNGSNLDVLEIDAASNRGIDEIRALREKIKFSPSSLLKKVYIIDEIHMLTQEAFNALLKTLEEPPAHALFIVCTTEPWKLPPTIVSRTFHIPFEKPSKGEVLRSLARVVKGEKLQVEEGVFEELYELSEGSFRDATKILEELSLLSEDKKVTKVLFDSLFHTRTIESEVEKLTAFLLEKNVKKALHTIDTLSQKGVDVKLVNQKLVERLHLLARGYVENMDEKKISLSEVVKLIEYFSESYTQLRYAVIPQLPLELAIIQWCVIDQSQNSSPPTGGAKLKAQSDQIAVRSDVKEEKNQDVERSHLSKKQSSDDDFLKQLIVLVKKENHSIAGILRGCTLSSIKDNEVVIETAYKFHKDKLSEKKTREIIEKRASEILGKEVKVSIEMRQ